MLAKPVSNCPALKGWAMRIAKGAGMHKAKVALARKLAVILHRMPMQSRSIRRPRPLQLKQEVSTTSGPATTPGSPRARSLARTMYPVRPPCGKWFTTTQSVDWPAGSSMPHQATAIEPIPYRSKCPATGTRKKD